MRSLSGRWTTLNALRCSWVPHPSVLRFSIDVQCFFLFGVVRRTFLFLSGLCCRLKQWEQLRTVVARS